MNVALHLPHRMTVAEFWAWVPPDELADRRWELVDGEPVCMAPTTLTHGILQAELSSVLSQHLARVRPGCRVVIHPGVSPRARAVMNHRIPDVGITCAPVPPGERFLPEPLLLAEMLSPSNEVTARANVWAYTTIPSVHEILLLSTATISAELLRRDAEKAWPASPLQLGADDTLVLESVGLSVTMRSLYRTSGLI